MRKNMHDEFGKTSTIYKACDLKSEQSVQSFDPK